MNGDLYDEDGYCPEGAWVEHPSGFTYFDPALTIYRDMVSVIHPKVKQWAMYGSAFADKRKAQLLAGRLAVFYTGVKVAKQNDTYFILYWQQGESNG